MIFRLLKIFLLIISFSICAQINDNLSQNKYFELEINILKIKKPGTAFIAIYNNSLDFNSGDESKNRITYALKENVKKGSFSKVVMVEEGTYGVKIYIDKNNNNKFDFNIIGIPKEQFGFSNDAISLLGPPSFKNASFDVLDNKTIYIKMK
jgi:uncharacterized protein (DUF2141 family)